MPREPSVRRMIADVGRISNVVSVGCFWAVFTCGVLGVGCTVEHRDSALPAAVIVVPGGLNKQVSDIYDGQVSYQVRDPYPGERTIGEIHRRLGAEGWRRRNYDFMNPTLTAEITAQWRTLETAAGDSIAWAEQWENAAGDVVAYGFKYSVPTGREPTAETSMEVLVSHFRAATVRKLEAEIR